MLLDTTEEFTIDFGSCFLVKMYESVKTCIYPEKPAPFAFILKAVEKWGHLKRW